MTDQRKKVCVCGHGKSFHSKRQATFDWCNIEGCACRGYVRVTAPSPLHVTLLAIVDEMHDCTLRNVDANTLIDGWACLLEKLAREQPCKKSI